MTVRKIPFWGFAFICILLTSSPLQAGSNLLFNGSFDCPTNHTAGWMYDFRWLGNNYFMNNHTLVSWLDKDGSRKSVLKIHATRPILFESGQGVWVDSKLIPYEYPYRYKATLWARNKADTSDPGPNARIFMCGVKWLPGVKPHPDPDLSEMAPKPPSRLIQQGSGHMLYFGKKGRDLSGVKSTWTKGETVFPGAEVPSKEEVKRLKLVDFIFLHICAQDGYDGDLMIDDVSIEKLDKIPSLAKPAPAPQNTN